MDRLGLLKFKALPFKKEIILAIIFNTFVYNEPKRENNI